MAFLHGSEVIEIDDGARAISTVKMGVIGLVFESEQCAPAIAARLSVGSVALDDAMTFTAVTAGNASNALNISLMAEGASADIAVTVTEKHIAIMAATDAEGAMTSTAAEIVDAINNAPEAAQLITASLPAGTDGGAVPMMFGAKYLTGGADEPFPYHVPVAIAGSVKAAEGMGIRTDAYKSVKNMLKQTGALIVAVRAKPLKAPQTNAANITEAISYFADAKGETGYKPRILVAPGFSHVDGVAKELEVMAKRLRAFAYIDCELSASYTDAMKRARSFGDRVEVQWPHVKVQDDTGEYVPRPLSEFAAGLRARIDNEKGVHWSKSNQEIYGIVGTWQRVSWELSDKSSIANQLNENKVSTVIREGGFRFWGNRSCAIDPKWTFECVRRVADMINDSIELNHLWAVDRPGTTQYLQDVLGGIQAYMRDLTNQGIIPGGSAWLDPELNSPSQMQQGIYYFDFDFGVYYPAEHLIFRSHLNNGYLEEVIANV
ncbi:phage tail sheath subtilisin-like domain-containing protein [Photobacterium leiognathi]|uniref:phage tail sheath subtilisin-like domain-containing protein n=1 Tax=Photobacterium leiognathi TaxID=553611 RepID=UPI002738C678|nr:phage tail sheath subtilisin-like domain-containing protein [Photobacterium leiognathi]